MKAEPTDERKLTAADVAEIRALIKKLKGDPYAVALYDDLQAMLAAGAANASDLLGIKVDLEGVKQSWAMQALRDHVGDFAVLINQREQDYLEQLLDQGLADGWTPKRLKDEISQSFAEGYHILGDTGELDRTIPSDSWAEMVARTELNRAQTFGALSLYSAAGIEKIQWLTTGGGDVCDICAPADGEIVKMGQVFDSVDVDAPPAHPRCNCAVIAADDDVRLTGEEMQASGDFIDRVNTQSREKLKNYLNG